MEGQVIKFAYENSDTSAEKAFVQDVVAGNDQYGYTFHHGNDKYRVYPRMTEKEASELLRYETDRIMIEAFGGSVNFDSDGGIGSVCGRDAGPLMLVSRVDGEIRQQLLQRVEQIQHGASLQDDASRAVPSPPSSPYADGEVPGRAVCIVTDSPVVAPIAANQRPDQDGYALLFPTASACDAEVMAGFLQSGGNDVHCVKRETGGFYLVFPSVTTEIEIGEIEGALLCIKQNNFNRAAPDDTQQVLKTVKDNILVSERDMSFSVAWTERP